MPPLTPPPGGDQQSGANPRGSVWDLVRSVPESLWQQYEDYLARTSMKPAEPVRADPTRPGKIAGPSDAQLQDALSTVTDFGPMLTQFPDKAAREARTAEQMASGITPQIRRDFPAVAEAYDYLLKRFPRLMAHLDTYVEPASSRGYYKGRSPAKPTLPASRGWMVIDPFKADNPVETLAHEMTHGAQDLRLPAGGFQRTYQQAEINTERPHATVLNSDRPGYWDNPMEFQARVAGADKSADFHEPPPFPMFPEDRVARKQASIERVLYPGGPTTASSRRPTPSIPQPMWDLLGKQAQQGREALEDVLFKLPKGQLDQFRYLYHPSGSWNGAVENFMRSYGAK